MKTKALIWCKVTVQLICIFIFRGARWPSGRASDSKARGWGFDTYFCRVVSLSKDTFTPQKVLVIPRKRWLLPDMTEKLFTRMLSHNKTKTKSLFSHLQKAGFFHDAAYFLRINVIKILLFTNSNSSFCRIFNFH